jgi:hypothetical protein
MMLRGRRALIDVVKHCWALRPFILSESSPFEGTPHP